MRAMSIRKLGCLVLAVSLPGIALLGSMGAAAAPPDAGLRMGADRAVATGSIDAVVEPIGSAGAGAVALQGEDGALLDVQYGGWGSSNSSWGGGWPVTCQSSNNRRRTCNKPSNQTVRIDRQLSNTRCTQGVNWGQNRSQIWVDNGCSARFVPTGNWNGGNNGNWGGGNNWNRPEVVCESRNFRYNQCNWRNNWGFPQLVQQISQVRCVRDRNWGYNRSRAVIWVNDGCAARFRGR
jgi:Protein of unknown function (DUF3011)